jgi:hypothetical protein
MYAAFRRAAASAAAAAAAAMGGSLVAATDAPTPAPQSATAAAPPPGLHLIQATVVFRHGDRAPVHKHHALPSDGGFEGVAALPRGAPVVELVDIRVRGGAAGACRVATAPAHGCD